MGREGGRKDGKEGGGKDRERKEEVRSQHSQDREPGRARTRDRRTAHEEQRALLTLPLPEVDS